MFILFNNFQIIIANYLSLFMYSRFFSSKPEAVIEQNVNLTDVEHHSKLSDDWWDPSGPMKGRRKMLFFLTTEIY